MYPAGGILPYKGIPSLLSFNCILMFNSLLASLHFYRPDIILPSVDSPSYSPIPLNPPPEFFQSTLFSPLFYPLSLILLKKT